MVWVLLSTWLRVTLLNLVQCVKVGSLHCSFILSKIFVKTLQKIISGLAKLLGSFFLETFRDIKYRRSTDAVRTDGTFIYLFSYISAEQILMCSPLISHVLNILLLWEFETAWCGTLGGIPRTLKSHQNYKWNFHCFTHTSRKTKNKQKIPHQPKTKRGSWAKANMHVTAYLSTPSEYLCSQQTQGTGICWERGT